MTENGASFKECTKATILGQTGVSFLAIIESSASFTGVLKYLGGAEEFWCFLEDFCYRFSHINVLIMFTYISRVSVIEEWENLLI